MADPILAAPISVGLSPNGIPGIAIRTPGTSVVQGVLNEPYLNSSNWFMFIHGTAIPYKPNWLISNFYQPAPVPWTVDIDYVNGKVFLVFENGVVLEISG